MPVAVVTGAAGGIGSVAVGRWANRGYRVFAVDLPGLRVPRRDPRVTVLDVDATSATAVGIAAAEIGPVDRLFTSAGVVAVGSIADVPLASARRAMEVNYFGTLHWAQAILPSMIARGSGEMAFMASLAGWWATPLMGAYTASKFAVVGLAETLKAELAGTGVVFRCVCPPGVQTGMLDRIVAEGMPASAVRRGPVITPDAVIDALDRSWSRRSPYVFPGPGTAALWRAQRFAPGVTSRLGRMLIRS